MLNLGNKLSKSIEIGGEFHWNGLPKGPFLSWPSPHLFLALGRDTVLSLWREKRSETVDRSFFVPDYFCPDICKFWKDNGIKIRHYEDDPRWPHPDWKTLMPAHGDFVLAVNYFGVRSGAMWKEWHKRNPRVFLIEDHSHDPLSMWAQTSSADYAFASIRKNFPAPDGAILWSPRHNPLPPEPENRNWSGSALKLAGMIWKKEYLDTYKIDSALKDIVRKFQIEGEQLLSESENLSISPWSRSLLLKGFPENWRIQREKNVRLLLDFIKECNNFKPLFSDWPLGHCPFNVVLVFNTEMYRETFRYRIISKGIFTPVHWALNSGNDGHTLDLSRRILTIPVDQRYSANDMRCIADVIKEIDNSM